MGLTGGVATGKTSVARIFMELGARVVDADELARSSVEPGTETFKRILQEFGENILGSDGKLDRRKIRQIIFSDERKKKKLEEIIHPVIGKMLMDSIEREREKGTEILILDIPLLFENNMQIWIRPVILVYTDLATQKERLMERDGISEKEAEDMIKGQMPMEEKKKLADFIIDNNKDLNYTKNQVKIIWEELKK